MAGKPVNVLSGVQTVEVSLVRRGANNKRFALTKAEEDMEFKELLKAVLDTEAEGEAKLVETLKAAKADEDTVQAAVASFRLQHGFKDKLSKDVFGEVLKAAGFKPGFKPEDKEEDMDEEEMAAKKKKAAKLDKEPACKTAELPAEMQVLFKAQQDELEAVRKDAEATKKALETERADRVRKEYVQKCATDYAHVPGMSADEMGEMLQKAYAVSKEFGEKLEKSWADASKAVKDGAHLRSAGSPTPGAVGGAMDKVRALAKEYIAKDAKLSEDVAIAKVLADHSELYEAYLQENPKQLGR